MEKEKKTKTTKDELDISDAKKVLFHLYILTKNNDQDEDRAYFSFEGLVSRTRMIFHKDEWNESYVNKCIDHYRCDWLVDRGKMLVEYMQTITYNGTIAGLLGGGYRANLNHEEDILSEIKDFATERNTTIDKLKRIQKEPPLPYFPVEFLELNVML